MLKIREFIWRDSVLEKLAWKHSVSPLEVEQALQGAHCKIIRNLRGHVKGEDIYNALGRTESGRYISVFFVLKYRHDALILSARNMSFRERRLYAKK